MVIATVVMGLSFVSSIGRTIEMSKLRTLKMEKVKLDMSKLMNKYFNELNSGDFLEKKHELLNYVKVENPWIVDIQSVDRKEEYLNIEVITNDNEVKTIACSLEDVFNKIPSLNEKDVEIKEENKKEKKKIEKELEKMEKKKRKSKIIFLNGEKLICFLS